MLSSNGRIQIIDQRYFPLFGGNITSLTISNATSSDDGIYSCVAGKLVCLKQNIKMLVLCKYFHVEYQESRVNSSISTVFIPGIVLHTNGSNLTAVIGESYGLPCNASNVRFRQWFHNDILINNIDPIITDFKIINVMFSDAGKYECRLTNHLDRYQPRNVSIVHFLTVTGIVDNVMVDVGYTAITIGVIKNTKC